MFGGVGSSIWDQDPDDPQTKSDVDRVGEPSRAGFAGSGVFSELEAAHKICSKQATKA